MIFEDEQEEDHISEHLHVDEFSESIVMAHHPNFAAAAFRGLVQGNLDIGSDDFMEVLAALEFVEVTQVPVPADTGDSLTTMLQEVLTPVPCAPGYFIYAIPDNQSSSFATIDEESEHGSVYAGLASEGGSELLGHDIDEEDFNKSNSQDEVAVFEFENSADITRPSPPIFVVFHKDDVPIVADTVRIENTSARISVLLSVFKGESATEATRKVDPSELAPTHVEAALRLQSILNAYVADRNLERLRYHGNTIADSDARLARAYFKRSREVATATIDVFFYSAEKDSIIPARTVEFGKVAMLGFDLLAAELQANEAYLLSPYNSSDSYISLAAGASECLIQWLFVKISRANGLVVVDVKHPDGFRAASRSRDDIVGFVANSCHRVNQKLLLRALVQTRTASSLLIPQEGNSRGEEYAGFFGCKIMFQTSFKLNRRCALNPEMTAKTLEASVLQNFAVSNRSRIFVYKDESGSVFYLNLSVCSEKGNEGIDLVVRGLQSPGPSITIQLNSLLRKRLLLIAVDLFSTVLTMNYWYGWKQEDIDFIHSFRNEFAQLDDNRSVLEGSTLSRTYEIPRFMTDPTMLLLLFRQNICGSFFFFPLQTTEDAFHHEGVELSQQKDSNAIKIRNMTLRFFFNGYKSKLDPKFQAESTLTERGQEISKRLGAGIAIIYVTLLSNEEVIFGEETPRGSTRPVRAMEDMHLKECTEVIRGTFVKVTIVDTNMKDQLLHEWVLLTLNQVLVAWLIERHIERYQHNLFLDQNQEMRCAGNCKRDKIVPGLPFFQEVLEDAYFLPHPAVHLLELNGVVRSSAVSRLALDSLRCLATELSSESQWHVTESDLQGDVIRTSRFCDPETIDLVSNGLESTVSILRKGETEPILDSPLDCVDYTILYFVYGDTKDSSFPKVFEDVSVAFSKSEICGESASIFEAYKCKHPSKFVRSFGFVLTVKRNVRRLLTYNWNSRLVDRVFVKLGDVNRNFVRTTSERASSLLSTSLGCLAPRPLMVESRAKPKDAERPPTSSTSTRGSFTKPARSQTLSRPKLIGKSVEGSAMKAMERSRARASSKRPEAKTIPRGTNRQLHDSRISASRISTVSQNARRSETKVSMFLRSFDFACQCAGFRQSSSRSKWHRKVVSSTLSPHLAKHSDLSIVQAVFFSGALLQFELCPVLPFPDRCSEYLVTLAGGITNWYPDFSLLETTPSAARGSEVYLATTAQENGRNKYFVVLRLALSRFADLECVSFEARVVSCGRKRKVPPTFPQRTIERHHSTKRMSLWHFRLPKVTLAGNLLDHMCSVMNKLVQNLESPSPCNRLVLSLHTIIENILPLEEMLFLPSRFKIFQVSIVLKSYKDSFIDQFNSDMLMNSLQTEDNDDVFEARGLQGCFFRQQLSICSTSSRFVLRRNMVRSDAVALIVVCRSRGRNLNDLVFRDNSSTMAITVLDCIAGEGANLAYHALRNAAIRLRQSRLWAIFSSPSSATTPTSLQLGELLSLCKSRPLNGIFDIENSELSQLFEDRTLITSCAEAMIEDEAFCPSWRFKGSTLTPDFLFYVSDVGAFIFVQYHHEVAAPIIRILVKDGFPSSLSANLIDVSDKLVNFLLHFVWSDI